MKILPFCHQCVLMVTSDFKNKPQMSQQ